MLNKKELLVVNEVVKAFDNTCHVVANEKEIIIKGKPNLDKLDKTEAKHFYSTLLSVILEYYEKTVTDKTKWIALI